MLAVLAAIGLVTAGFLAGLWLGRRNEAKLRHLAMFDPLTELFNRRAFMELASREIARTRRTGEPYALLMMDLDHFKRVNDEFGHASGDRTLKAIAAIAARGVRGHDIVGRYGGEEFCALLPAAGAEEARAIAERVRAAVAAHVPRGLARSITVSIGVAVCRSGQTCPLVPALARADEALYRAKHEGRDRVVVLEFPSGRKERHREKAAPAQGSGAR